MLKITVLQNKELQDKLDYLMENQPKTNVETRDAGVECDLPSRYFNFLLLYSKLLHNVLYCHCVGTLLAWTVKFCKIFLIFKEELVGTRCNML